MSSRVGHVRRLGVQEERRRQALYAVTAAPAGTAATRRAARTARCRLTAAARTHRCARSARTSAPSDGARRPRPPPTARAPSRQVRKPTPPARPVPSPGPAVPRGGRTSARCWPSGTSSGRPPARRGRGRASVRPVTARPPAPATGSPASDHQRSMRPAAAGSAADPGTVRQPGRARRPTPSRARPREPDRAPATAGRQRPARPGRWRPAAGRAGRARGRADRRRMPRVIRTIGGAPAGAAAAGPPVDLLGQVEHVLVAVLDPRRPGRSPRPLSSDAATWSASTARVTTGRTRSTSSSSGSPATSASWMNAEMSMVASSASSRAAHRDAILRSPSEIESRDRRVVCARTVARPIAVTAECPRAVTAARPRTSADLGDRRGCRGRQRPRVTLRYTRRYASSEFCRVKQLERPARGRWTPSGGGVRPR